MSWEKGCLADLADEIRDSFIPDGNQEYPCVTLDNIEPGTLYISSIGNASEVSSSKFRFKNGDILFGKMRPYFRKVVHPEFDGVCSTELCVIRPKSESDAKFVFYYTAQQSFIDYATANSKGDRPRTKWQFISKYSSLLPSLKEREKIGDVLSKYDGLLENNLRRIELLEESARLLYREWFVYLRFPGHEHTKITKGVPEGWRKEKIGGLLAKIKRKRKIHKEDYLEEGPIPCVDQSQKFIGGYIDIEEAKHDAPLPIIVFGDHTRILKFIDFPFASGADGTQLLYPNDASISPEYLYFVLNSVDLSNYFYARHFKFLKEQEVLIGDLKLIRNFTDIIKPSMKQISLLKEQNRKLQEARDILLPRLMNGDIAV